jgi:hypothetical protein
MAVHLVPFGFSNNSAAVPSTYRLPGHERPHAPCHDCRYRLIRPAAFILNVLVSAIGTVQFARAGMLKWRTFYPFALLGIPRSIAGGATHLPGPSILLSWARSGCWQLGEHDQPIAEIAMTTM